MSSMGAREGKAFLVASFMCLATAAAMLSPKGVNYEVQALMNIKASLKDPHGALGNWDKDSVDPCSWTMITCSSENLVTKLEALSQNLSGTLSPSIGNLTNLQSLLLPNNDISGTIPSEIGKLTNLLSLDLSNNNFSGGIPADIGKLTGLQYLRLNNNNLSGAFPQSLANITDLVFMDLSYNNLSGPVPKFPARTFSIVGNPLICSSSSEQECYGTVPVPMSFNANSSQSTIPKPSVLSFG